MDSGIPVAAWVIIIILALILAMIFLAGCQSKQRKQRKQRKQGTGGGPDTFPYWSKSLSPAKEMFQELKKTLFAITPSGQGPILTRTYPGDYKRSDALSNHYTEAARIECQSGGDPTPREVWEEMAAGRHRRAAENNADLSPEKYRVLREDVYGGARECNIFNPAFAYWVLSETVGSGARVLDPSAGWGDRLIGSLAANAKYYHGYDPNPHLQDGYKKIVAKLGNERHKSFYVTEAPFEEAQLKEESYDIAFTSPPYFAFEEYIAPGGEGEKAQSIGRYPDYETWAEKMYRPYLSNAYRAVRKGGWIILYIEDIRLGGKHYPLRTLTKDIMDGLGASPATNFGLRVIPSPSWPPAVDGGGRGRKKRPPQKKAARVRWALGWRKT